MRVRAPSLQTPSRVTALEMVTKGLSSDKLQPSVPPPLHPMHPRLSAAEIFHNPLSPRPQIISALAGICCSPRSHGYRGHCSGCWHRLMRSQGLDIVKQLVIKMGGVNKSQY